MYKLNASTSSYFQPGEETVYKGKKYELKEMLVKVLKIENTEQAIRVTVANEAGENASINFWYSDFGRDPNIYKNGDAFALAEIAEGDTITVLGFEYEYNGYKQINPFGGYRWSDKKIEVKENVNKEKILSSIKIIINSMEDDKLKKTCYEVLKLHWEDFVNKPAANKHHHNYIGGLLQHTYEVMAISYNTSSLFTVDRDVVITSALFHDIMKICEYSNEGEWQEFGDMIGHVVGSAELFKTIASEFDVDIDKVDKIYHCILSHHGRLEWGSPITPHSMEAVILHCADLMSSQMNAIACVGDKKDSYVNYY